MASRLKLKKRKKSFPPDPGRPDTLDYNEAAKDPRWVNEKILADKIMDSLRKLGLDIFKLDELTKGEGSCFMIAIIQQLNRREVFDNSREEVKELARTKDQYQLRIVVKNFICRDKINHPKVQWLRYMHELDQIAKAADDEETETWEEYWRRLMIDNEWADSYFIRATALYLNMTIQIMETGAKEAYSIEGDIDDEGSDEVLYIGYVSKVHYQSLLLNDSESSSETDDSELSELEVLENEAKTEEVLMDDLEEDEEKVLEFKEDEKPDRKTAHKEKEKLEVWKRSESQKV